MSRAESKLCRVELEVKGYDEKGRLIAVRRKESDLILKNYVYLVSLIIYPFAVADRGADLVDQGGVTRREVVYNDSATMLFGYRSGNVAAGAQIAVGTSTVAPTRDDYKLGAEVKRGAPTVSQYVDKVTIAVSLVLDAAADITEAGVVCRMWAPIDGIMVDIFLFRDTFTAVSVPAGGTISVTYTLSF